MMLWMTGSKGTRNLSRMLRQISMMRREKFMNKWLGERKTQNEEWYQICLCLSWLGRGGRKIACVWSLWEAHCSGQKCYVKLAPPMTSFHGPEGKSLLSSLPAVSLKFTVRNYSLICSFPHSFVLKLAAPRMNLVLWLHSVNTFWIFWKCESP